jgi:hypothetical protein
MTSRLRVSRGGVMEPFRSVRLMRSPCLVRVEQFEFSFHAVGGYSGPT